MTKIRYGIVSTATIVPRFVAGIRQSEAGEVVAISGRNLEKAKKVAEELSIPRYYDNYQDIYLDDQVDVVYIANYNGGHFACVEKAIQHGKNVLCEKPLCLSYDEATYLFKLAEEKQVFLMEAQKAVFLPITKMVKEIIQSGRLGKIYWVNVISCHTGAKRGAWFDDLANGGGILNGAGTYPLEYLQYIFDSPLTNYAGSISQEPGMSDNGCVMTMSVKDSLLVSILLTITLKLESKIEILGEHGQIVIPNYWKTNRAELIIDGTTEILEATMDSEFVYEINHVNDCLLANKKTSHIMKPEITISAIQIIDEIHQSHAVKA